MNAQDEVLKDFLETGKQLIHQTNRADSAEAQVAVLKAEATRLEDLVKDLQESLRKAQAGRDAYPELHPVARP